MNNAGGSCMCAAVLWCVVLCYVVLCCVVRVVVRLCESLKQARGAELASETEFFVLCEAGNRTGHHLLTIVYNLE